MPLPVTLGVRGNGARVVLDLRLVGEESAASWTEVVASLTARHLARPVLAIIDGNPGLMNALQSHWPGIVNSALYGAQIMEVDHSHLRKCMSRKAGIVIGSAFPPLLTPFQPVLLRPVHQSYLHPVVSMGSARTECPECFGSSVVDLADILYSPRVDFFRCPVCLCWWMVPKGSDEPATRIVLGNANGVAIMEKAG